jgi:hypothetical protein
MPKTARRKSLQWFDRDYRPRGYTIRVGGSGHLKIIAPDGYYVATVSATPSDPRGIRNAQAQLRRYEASRRELSGV